MSKVLECAKVDPSSGCNYIVRGETEGGPRKSRVISKWPGFVAAIYLLSYQSLLTLEHSVGLRHRAAFYSPLM